MKHRQIILTLLLVATSCSLRGQRVTHVLPEALRIASDTLRIKFSNSSYVIPLVVRRDTIDMGTDGTIGMTATIYHGGDSTVIRYNNIPFEEVYFIRIATPSKTPIYRLHFNPVSASFSRAYIERNRGKTQFEIPEVFELANVIWILSPSGQRAKNLYKEGVYYDKVRSYFTPFVNHPIFKSLDVPDSSYFSTYYDFRENSLAYQFRENDLVTEGPYYYVVGNDWQTHNSLFRKLTPLIEDFAVKSKYRAFYEDNKSFYAQQVSRERELMPVNEMWTWLEKEFPEIKYQSYKIVFSPLIGGTHSTQNFSTFSYDKWFNESVMFVCGARTLTITGL
jgi:hypothetical protein